MKFLCKNILGDYNRYISSAPSLGRLRSGQSRGNDQEKNVSIWNKPRHTVDAQELCFLLEILYIRRVIFQAILPTTVMTVIAVMMMVMVVMMMVIVVVDVVISFITAVIINIFFVIIVVFR